jgi:cupin fold WbuC family metalloprotein
MSDSRGEGPVPRALKAPKGPVIVLEKSLLGKTVEMSRKSPRLRIILPFHKTSGDPLQRMLNTLQPGSYIRPHRHVSPQKAESVIVLQGSIAFITFKENGQKDDLFILSSDSDQLGIDIDPGVYHTFFALERDTVLFEVKPGPYSELSDKDFAPWAPAEGAEGDQDFLKGLYDLIDGRP